jgi:hypothetical protein
MQAKKANIIPMPGAAPTGKKTVPCRQDAIDVLPAGSGDWSVEGVPGLILRCGATKKTFRVQRRINGRLVSKVLGELTAAAARRQATLIWQRLKPAPPEGKMTLDEAWQRYMDERPLAATTRRLFEYNIKKYLAEWRGRSLEQIGQDRAGRAELVPDALAQARPGTGVAGAAPASGPSTATGRG